MLLEIFESFSNKVFLKIFWMAKLLNSRVPSFVGTVKCSTLTNGTLFLVGAGELALLVWDVYFPAYM